MPEAAPRAAPARDKADFAAFDGGEIRFGYCTEFIAQRTNKKDPRLLRAFLIELGAVSCSWTTRRLSRSPSTPTTPAACSKRRLYTARS